MSIFSFLKRKNKQLPAPAEAKGVNSVLGITSLISGGSAASKASSNILNAYSSSPWLHAVTNRTSNTVAYTKWRLYRVSGNKKTEIKHHPLLNLLKTYNKSMTSSSAQKVMQTHIDLSGESFVIVERDFTGQPVELFPIPPDWVLELPSEKNKFTFRVNIQTGGQTAVKLISSDDMIWIKNVNPEDPYGRGVGLGVALADELDTDEYAAKHVKAWFYNKAMPDILVGVEGASEDELHRAKSKLESKHRGVDNNNKSFWHSGSMKVEKISQSFVEQQLVELRTFQRNTIIQVFGVPPEMLGIVENSNRATIDAADYIYARWVGEPRIQTICDAYNKTIVKDFGDDIELGFDSIVPADKEFIRSVLEKAPHIRTVNEWRELIGDQPIFGDNGTARSVLRGEAIVQNLSEFVELFNVGSNGSNPKKANEL